MSNKYREELYLATFCPECGWEELSPNFEKDKNNIFNGGYICNRCNFKGDMNLFTRPFHATLFEGNNFKSAKAYAYDYINKLQSEWMAKYDYVI